MVRVCHTAAPRKPYLEIFASVQATRLARAMVTKYGMSDALGKVAINYDDNGRSVSSETRRLVESEVYLLLSWSQRSLLTTTLAMSCDLL